jgi:hypothetical protein
MVASSSGETAPLAKKKEGNDDICGCHFSLLIQCLPNSRRGRLSQQWALILFVLIMALLQYRQSTQLSSWVASMVMTQHSQNPQLSNVVLFEEVPSISRRHHIVMAQYTGRSRAADNNTTDDTYERFLSLTSKINIAYARKWGYDFWILRGLPFSGPHLNASYTLERHVIQGQLQEIPQSISEDANEVEPTMSYSRATYNKLTLLQLALQEEDESLHGILILDADAMMYDFSRDIAGLLLPNTVVVAHSTNTNNATTNSDASSSGSINVGVTLWNIRHPLAPLVYQRWRDRCVRRILYHPDKMDDDQAPLQHILKYELDAERRSRVVTALEGKEFHYASGTFVRHFIRPAGSTWTSYSTADGDALRLQKMQRSIAEVCARNQGVCDAADAARG